MKRCPSCAATFDVAAGFCPNDGAALLEVGGPARRVGVDEFVPDSTARRQVGGAAAWQAAPASIVATAPAVHPAPAAAEVVHSGKGGARYDQDGEEILVGSLLAERYQIDKPIGAGGMGVVYRAVHVGIDKPVAVKVLRSEYASVEDVAKRFEIEARVASKISHPNVVDISDYGMTPGGSPYYVMELLGGDNLGDTIDAGGPIEPQRAVDIARALAYGLDAAHAHGIVHRDLKPDNVFLVPSHGTETPKILDFGIARVKTKRTRLTAAGSIVGTPEYMSPEQAQGKEVDARADIYSLAAILFEMLSGTVPLRGATLVETLTKQVYDTPPRLSEVAPQLADHTALEELIARSLAKDPNDRPASAEQFADALANALPKELGLASESAERLKATVAMGSWSVGNLPNPEAPASDSQHRGPVLNQGQPNPIGFGPTPIPGPQPLAGAAAQAPLAAQAPVAAQAPPGSGPPHSGGHAGQAGHAGQGGHATGAPQYTQRPTQQLRRRSGMGWPSMLLIGGLGSVGVGFGVVALFRILGSEPATPATTLPEAQMEAQMAAREVQPSPAESAPQVETAEASTGVDDAGGGGDLSAADSATGATGATGEPEAAPEPTKKVTKAPKKSTKAKKKKKKTTKAPPEGTKKVVVDTTGSNPTTTPKEPEPEKPKDPPPDPGVSLGDLRDPFG